MKGQLAVLNVSPRAESLYRRVLRATSTDLAGHATELGWREIDAAEALEELLTAGLVRHRPDGTIQVDHPRAALERLIDAEEARLDDRRRELAAARGAISQFTEDHSFGQAGARHPVTGWETVAPEVAPSVVEYLSRTTGGLIRSCVQSLDIGPGLDHDAVRTTQSALIAGREQRTLYPMVALSDPNGRDWMHSWARVGEQQRVMERPPHDFAVFGSNAVMAAVEWGAPTGGYVVIRDAMLVQAFSTVFDQAWRLALPVHDGSDASADDRRLLGMLGSGFKDEAIARYLGWGVRTVRRRVSRLMDELGVDSRFQLGAAAQRRHLLDGDILR
ncbi:hypothetical protein [Segeticoccus rhizosphaerae]|jgi:DNA-binding CsgD family transcriptional regulator|uniref:hypothetical protein n=1 Tax=Segeticoccus rhizosphaerae TaxID=1104777 RepID=UPI0010C05449|nr:MULTISPECIES: hypothetical protein [Intrasporangiaceae]